MKIRLHGDPVECHFDPSTVDDAHLFVFPGFMVEALEGSGEIEFGLRVQPMGAVGFDPNPEDFIEGEDHPPLRLMLEAGGSAGPMDLAFAVFGPDVADDWEGVALWIGAPGRLDEGRTEILIERGEGLGGFEAIV